VSTPSQPERDHLLVSEIHGEARHYAARRELTADERAAAVAALRELAGGRADLLAEVAGLMEGVAEGQPNEPLIRQAAQLCRDAGADPELIPGWVEEGRPAGAAPAWPGRLSGGCVLGGSPGLHGPDVLALAHFSAGSDQRRKPTAAVSCLSRIDRFFDSRAE